MSKQKPNGSEGNFVFLSDVIVLGVPVGYRSRVNAGERIMKFRKLPIR